MARRSGRRQDPVSLFAFQDIITSVTAIMILLVLILTLEFVTRSQQEGVSADDRRVAGHLREAVATLARRANLMAAEVAETQAAATRAAGFAAADVQRRRDEAIRQTTIMKAEINLLEAKIRTAEGDRRAAEASLVKQASRTGASTVEDVTALEERVREIDEANRAERRRQDDARARPRAPESPRLVFNPAHGETRQPLLVEIASDGLTLLSASSEANRRFPALGLTASPQFNAWLAKLNKQTHYVVLIVRPSGAGYYGPTHSAVRAAGVDVGTELVPESMVVELATAGPQP